MKKQKENQAYTHYIGAVLFHIRKDVSMTPSPALLMTISLISIGCSTPYPIEWQGVEVTDELTGTVVCRVKGLSPMQTGNSFYPFVDMLDDQIRVGIHSPDENPIPVGNIEIQINHGFRWHIEQATMPYYLQSEMDILPHIMMGHGHTLRHEKKPQRDQLQLSFETVSANARRSRSPYTVATGKAAQQLFHQMLEGGQFKYRVFNANRGLSIFGRYDITPDFLAALQTCDIRWSA